MKTSKIMSVLGLSVAVLSAIATYAANNVFASEYFRVNPTTGIRITPLTKGTQTNCSDNEQKFCLKLYEITSAGQPIGATLATIRGTYAQ